MRCGQAFYFWDGEYDSRCELPEHDGTVAHWDGMSYLVGDDGEWQFVEADDPRALAASRHREENAGGRPA